MAVQSKFPAGEEVSKAMRAYLENIEGRRPSNTTALDTGATTLAQLVAAYNQLILDLNK